MLPRRLHLLQAVSLNMSMMVGIGPFLTIPAFVATMGGPQAMIGRLLGAVVALTDGLVWCELAAAFPGSGGTYHFCDAAYGESTPGRLLEFLFVQQFFFSGLLEAATGAIGLAQYVSYFFPVLRDTAWSWSAIVPWSSARLACGKVGLDRPLIPAAFVANLFRSARVCRPCPNRRGLILPRLEHLGDAGSCGLIARSQERV